MLELLIDYREKKIITTLKELEEQKKLVITTKNLDLGDIIFKLLSDNTGSTTYEIIIERKEINDLISSIKDKRYKEQKHRIQSSISTNKHTTELIYLIEGSVDNIRNPRDIKMYHGSIISMLLRDNIKIVFTQDIPETCKFIERLYSRLSNKPHDFNASCEHTSINNTDGAKTSNIVADVLNLDTNTKVIDIEVKRGGTGSTSYLNTRVKKKKSDNITPANCGMLMLTYLPNMSLHIATELLGHFNNKISDLIAFVCDTKMDEKEKIKTLATKRIKSISGKERNFGPTNAKNLIDYLK
jgi:ERCC4-type nuclease